MKAKSSPIPIRSAIKLKYKVTKDKCLIRVLFSLTITHEEDC